MGGGKEILFAEFKNIFSKNKSFHSAEEKILSLINSNVKDTNIYISERNEIYKVSKNGNDIELLGVLPGIYSLVGF